MSTMRHVPGDPVSDPGSDQVADEHGGDVGTRAAELVDTLYAHAERERRRDSLDELLRRAESQPA